MPTKFRYWRDWRQSGSVRVCTSVQRVRRVWHHLVYEIVDNAIDEALAGYCTEIVVELLPDDVVRLPTTAEGFRLEFTRKRASLRQPLFIQSFTLAVSLAAAVTKFPAVCTALVPLLSMPFRNGWN